jgi:hypothetical protein
MLIWREEYDRLVREAAMATGRAELHEQLADKLRTSLDEAVIELHSLKARLAAVEEANLALQAKSYGQVVPHSATSDGTPEDIFAEDEGQVRQFVHDIKAYGRDAVLAREAAHERVE